jgi:hypothetical protein
MWILTDVGFISVVEHQDDMNMLQVRSRVREDISRIFPNAAVYEHDGADYLFRANISREEVANVLWEKMMTLDYTSHVKDVAIKRSAPAAGRSAAYYATWTAMSKMQPVPPYHKKNAKPLASFADRKNWWEEPEFAKDSPSAGSLASAGAMSSFPVPQGATRTPIPQSEEAEAEATSVEMTPRPVDTQVESICTESHRDARDVCDACGHSALVHPGLNDTDVCVMCELEHMATEFEFRLDAIKAEEEGAA